jgi:hypothetical protein
VIEHEKIFSLPLGAEEFALGLQLEGLELWWYLRYGVGVRLGLAVSLAQS